MITSLTFLVLLVKIEACSLKFNFYCITGTYRYGAVLEKVHIAVCCIMAQFVKSNIWTGVS